jgi:gliding motility-associated-like protein
MRKLITLFLVWIFSVPALMAQDDVGITGFTAPPASSCSFTTTENVTVTLFNFGPTDLSNVPIDISYQINAGPPSTDIGVQFPVFPSGSSVSHTFSVPANLATPGVYTFDGAVSLLTDVNPANDNFIGYVVTSNAPSVGGNITPVITTVCSSGNSGTLTLSGHSGTVLDWEFSTDGGFTWFSLGNTATTYNYLNLTQTTQYRAIVQNGTCPPANSAVATVTVVNPPAGGIVSATQTVCTGSNSGTLTLSGHTASVIRWEFSTDGGFTWTNIANVTTSQTFLNLTATRMYRAVVSNGTCAPVFSAAATVFVSSPAVGGTVASNATVCAPTNSGTLTLSGHTGTVGRWEYSTDGGFTWNNISNTTTSQTYSNLTTTTRYRAFVQNGACTAFSSQAIITVTPASVGGTVSSNATVCSGTNSGTLTLSGHTGNVVNWQFSTVSATGPWTPIANTTTTQNYTNLTTTTYYSAVVQSGTCATATSSVVTITVNPVSVGGTVSSSATVCAPTNSGTLTLAGHTGNVIRWEYSTDGGFTWITIGNTTTSQSYSNLTQTRQYRAVVQSGICPPANSSIATITVTPASVGGTVSSNATVCSGTNSGTLTLSGHTGNVVNWQFSTVSATGPWTPIANTTTTQNYTNLTTTTYYSAVVQSGTCATATSSVVTITVNPVSVGGTVSSSATVCASSNSGTLTLAGHTGNVIRWEYSTDGGFTWNTIANTSTSQAYNNLTQTRMYRAVVKSGVCNEANSVPATITVDPVSNAGVISGSTTVCASGNSGNLMASGITGNILEWLSSTTGPTGPWTSIANTTNTQSYLNLTQTTWYTIVVQSGVCQPDTATPAVITVDPQTVAGMVSANANVCSGSNNGTLTLSGNNGIVVRWEYSIDGGFNWINISNTTTTLTYNNLTTTTMYHAVVQSGVCPSDTSLSATIFISPLSSAGNISSNATVCSGSNSGTLTASGIVGNVLEWLSSTTGPAGPWTSIANTTASESYLNLTQTTWYTIVVQSGTCNPDTATPVQITVDPVSVGGSIASSATVCSGTNNGLLNLSGHTGAVLRWEYSNDGGFTWVTLSNNSTSQSYNNLTMTTMYQVIVQSGVCPSDTSAIATITVDQPSNAGIIASPATVCSGSNNGTLTVSGTVGTILEWLSSTSGPTGPWTSIANTTNSESYTNLTQTTWYSVVVQNGTCPSDTATPVMIWVNPAPLSVFTVSSDTVCIGTPIIFTSSSSVSPGFIQSYSWDFGDNTTLGNVNPVVHTYGSTGNFTAMLVVVSDQGCRDTSFMTIVINSMPSAAISANGPVTFCAGDSVTLSGPSGPDWSYLWTPGNFTTQSIVVNAAGTYTLLVTDTLTGCSKMDSIAVNVLVLPTVDAGLDTSISLGATITLNGSGNGSYSWLPFTVSDPFSANPSVTPTTTTTYTLTVTHANGCTASDSVKITVLEDFVVTVMNLITPNGDGFNDTWVIDGILNYPKNSVMIFNRNGQEVYQKNGYDNTWTGTFNGAELPDGTYYYVLTFEGSDKIYKGAVNVLRSR